MFIYIYGYMYFLYVSGRIRSNLWNRNVSFPQRGKTVFLLNGVRLRPFAVPLSANMMPSFRESRRGNAVAIQNSNTPSKN